MLIRDRILKYNRKDYIERCKYTKYTYNYIDWGIKYEKER